VTVTSPLGVRRARQALAVGSQSFALAGRLLPRRLRDEAAVIYAYCRRADDQIDEVPAHEAAGAVARLRAELDDLVAGVPQADPVLAAFQTVMHRRAISRVHVDDLLDGMAMDAVPGPIVYQSWDDLLLYCYRVAGTVGLMMCHVLGADDAQAARPAAALGMAMQLTNIARDVAEDWARGRLYIPRALLDADGGPALVPGGPLPTAAAARLARAVPQLLAAARPLYAWGDSGLVHLPTRAAITVRAARLIYSSIGDVIAARGHDVTAGRARVGRWRKLTFALRAATTLTLARTFA
jgi:phytoene synthase